MDSQAAFEERRRVNRRAEVAAELEVLLQEFDELCTDTTIMVTPAMSNAVHGVTIPLRSVGLSGFGATLRRLVTESPDIARAEAMALHPSNHRVGT